MTSVSKPEEAVAAKPIKDVDMDDLAGLLDGMDSSLGFVPRGVRKRGKEKAGI
jgi:hypothetical protein